MIINIIIAIIGISFLILVHEFGHFIVARYFNIAIRRFSIGFGPKLIGWKDSKGTEFVLSPILLGGFVSFVEQEQALPHQEHHCFANQPIRARAAVVLAGPIANLILTYCFFVFLNLYGIEGIKPSIAEVIEPSPAASAGLQAGDEIIRIDNTRVYTWQEANLNIVRKIGKSQIALEVQGSQGLTRPVNLDLRTISLGALEDQALFAVLGIKPSLPDILPIIDRVLANSPADRAGIKQDDRVLSVNGQPIEQWQQLTEYIAQSPNRPLNLVVERQQQELLLTLVPDPREDDPQQGFAGLGASQAALDDDYISVHRYGFIDAWQSALYKTYHSLELVLTSFTSLITGDLSIRSLSGPVSIVKYTSDSIHSGIQDFFFLLAFISISLFFFNLLPVPVLDGGHLLLYLIEAVKGGPFSLKFQRYYLTVGTLLLLSLFIFVTFNDILQLL